MSYTYKIEIRKQTTVYTWCNYHYDIVSCGPYFSIFFRFFFSENIFIFHYRILYHIFSCYLSRKSRENSWLYKWLFPSLLFQSRREHALGFQMVGLIINQAVSGHTRADTKKNLSLFEQSRFAQNVKKYPAPFFFCVFLFVLEF